MTANTSSTRRSREDPEGEHHLDVLLKKNALSPTVKKEEWSQRSSAPKKADVVATEESAFEKLFCALGSTLPDCSGGAEVLEESQRDASETKNKHTINDAQEDARREGAADGMKEERDMLDQVCETVETNTCGPSQQEKNAKEVAQSNSLLLDVSYDDYQPKDGDALVVDEHSNRIKVKPAAASPRPRRWAYHNKASEPPKDNNVKTSNAQRAKTMVQKAGANDKKGSADDNDADNLDRVFETVESFVCKESTKAEDIQLLDPANDKELNLLTCNSFNDVEINRNNSMQDNLIRSRTPVEEQGYKNSPIVFYDLDDDMVSSIAIRRDRSLLSDGSSSSISTIESKPQEIAVPKQYNRKSIKQEVKKKNRSVLSKMMTFGGGGISKKKNQPRQIGRVSSKAK